MSSLSNDSLKATLAERVKSDPADAAAWEQLGDLNAEAGENERALVCYRQVMALRPDDIEVQVNLERLSAGLTPARADADIKTLLAPANWLEIRIPLWFQVLLGIISFLITLILAEIQQWQVTDLVWSLWITSLTLGYFYLITGIVSNAIRQGLTRQKPGWQRHKSY